MLQTVPPAASDAHRKSVLGRAPRGVTRRYPRVLLGTSLVLLVLGSARGAAALCTANELCGASANPCVISGAIRTIGPACVLDFGSRAVQITTTLKAEQARGSFELRAGTLTLSGKLLSTGSASAPGGTIRVQTSGAFQMTSTADIDLSGGLGGGDLVVVAGSINWAGGSVKASGTSTDGGGGSISLVAGGSVVVAAALTAEGGRASGGGPVEITGDDVTVRASINVDGGNFDGGSVTITAADALSVLGSTTQISSHGALADEFAGYGGDITLSAGGNLRFEGQIESLGAAPDASGGFVDLSAGGSVELVAGSTITSTVASGEGTGGDVSLGAGLDVTVAGVLDAGGPAQGFGGNINVAATRDVTIATSGRLRVDAGEMAGMVSTHSPRLLTAAGLIDARGGSGGLGGDIILGPHCRAVLRGTFYAGAAGAGRAGSVQTLAATLAIEAPAVLTATPCSTPSTGCIRISLPAGSPSIDTGTTLNPTAVVTLAPSLRPCCGDGTLDVGEACDDGNRLFCDGCNSSCDVEGSPACPADGRLCTADCHPTQGCVFTNEPDGSACWDDGSVCTTDTCASGWCRHDPMVCNDGIACTTDSCHATLGCTAAPDNSRCDDRIACTVDTCSTTLGCTAAPDNSRCDDSIACTTDACSTTLGCTAAPDNSRCNDGVACTTDACSTTLGCTAAPDNSRCNDGVACTNDTCSATLGCTAAPDDSRCDDGVACTNDTCSTTLGCTAAPDDSRCDDGIACTTNSCHATLGCTATADHSLCDDSIACTTDACSTTLGCTAAPDNSRCNDGVACTNDTCSATLGCTAAPDNSRCNDGVACTNDTCSATLGCTAAPDNSRCNDGVACTNDTCDALAGCRRIADNSRCDDGIACTNDTCDALAGCVRTGDDTRCADGNPCTSDHCQSNVGCRSIPGNEGATCEDGSVCTLGDRCVRGACAGRTLLVCDDDNRCTTDRCEATTACVYEEEPALCSCGTASSPVPAGSDCADGEGCTAGDQCDGAGLCQPGAARDCNDGDACTSDICSDGRCTHDDSGCATTCAGLADGTPCSDGQVCNVGTCASGACVTETIDCDDGSACTGAEFCTESEGLGCVGSDASPFASMCRAADDYRCYKARIAPGNRPPPTRSVQVATVFGTRLLRTGAATLFCDPVSTDAAGRIDAAAGLGCYQLRADKGDSPPPARTLRIRNVFGLQSLSVREPANTLCLPSTVGGVSMAGVHDERACFTVRGRRFPGTTHGFLDAFEDIRATVLQPIMLCLATARDGVAASAPEEHLLCYRTRAASSVTTSSRYSVSLSNDFDGLGPQALGTTQAHSICVPTRIES